MELTPKQLEQLKELNRTLKKSNTQIGLMIKRVIAKSNNLYYEITDDNSYDEYNPKLELLNSIEHNLHNINGGIADTLIGIQEILEYLK